MGLRRKLRAAMKPVKHLQEDLNRDEDKLVRSKPLPTSQIVEIYEEEPPEQDGANYIPMEVKGSNGKKYKIVIPRTYYKSVPKTWHWNEDRYKAAELMAAGYPIKQVADIVDYSRMTLYGWLQHPEFKEHVDGLVLETGWANKRERIAGLNKVTELLFDKVVKEIDHVKLTDKSIGPVLTAILSTAKQLAQEKEEFVEQTKVEQNTTIEGTIGVSAIPVETYLNTVAAEDRKALEADFDQVGNDIIRSITGEKE